MDGGPAVHPLLLLGRHPALLHRAAQRGRGAVRRPPGGVPGAHRRLHGRGGRAGPGVRARRAGPAGVGPARGPGLLLGDRAAAGGLHAGGDLEHRPAGRPAEVGRRDGRAVPAGGGARLHQLGPLRDRAGRRRAGRLAGPAARAGRRAARPRRRGEALPGAVLRPAAGAVLAVPAAAGLLAGGVRRGARLVRGQPAGRGSVPGVVAALLRAQPGAAGRLRLALVRRGPPAHRLRHRLAAAGQRHRVDRRAARARRRAGARPARPAAAPAAAAALPRGRRLPARQQGVEPAVLAVAAAAGGAGPAVLAGAAALAGHRVPGLGAAAALVPRDRGEGRRLRLVPAGGAAARPGAGGARRAGGPGRAAAGAGPGAGG